MSWLLILLAVLILHGMILSVFVILEHRHPVTTIAWIALLIFVPLAGAVLYYFLGRVRFIRRRRLRTRSLRYLHQQRPNISTLQYIPEEIPEESETALGEQESSETQEKASHVSFATTFSSQHIPPLPPLQQPNLPLISLARRAADAPLSQGNTTSILQDAQQTYDCLEKAVTAATHHIHVLYYIIRDDKVGQWFRDLLVKQAQRGVQIRLMFDGVGSYFLSREFWQPLRACGAQIEAFLPPRFSPWVSNYNINFRNHRKLVIVDGKVGILGGINLGEEYLGKPPNAVWRDTHVQIQGPAVHLLQQCFAEDWCHMTGELLLSPPYYPKFPKAPGSDCVQIIPSGPDHNWYPIHLLFFLAITSALQRIWIATPYFIPDNSILTALITAAMRGVDVKILLPARGDHTLVHYAMRSYYQRLLRAGVEIYEYQKGMMHAKTIVVDGRCGTIGSANLDIRSFHLNFELNAFVYSRDFAQQLEYAFQLDLQDSQRVIPETFRKRPMMEHLYEAVARLLSPLL